MNSRRLCVQYCEIGETIFILLLRNKKDKGKMSNVFLEISKTVLSAFWSYLLKINCLIAFSMVVSRINVRTNAFLPSTKSHNSSCLIFLSQERTRCTTKTSSGIPSSSGMSTGWLFLKKVAIPCWIVDHNSRVYLFLGFQRVGSSRKISPIFFPPSFTFLLRSIFPPYCIPDDCYE